MAVRKSMHHRQSLASTTRKFFESLAPVRDEALRVLILRDHRRRCVARDRRQTGAADAIQWTDVVRRYMEMCAIAFPELS